MHPRERDSWSNLHPQVAVTIASFSRILPSTPFILSSVSILLSPSSPTLVFYITRGRRTKWPQFQHGILLLLSGHLDMVSRLKRVFNLLDWFLTLFSPFQWLKKQVAVVESNANSNAGQLNSAGNETNVLNGTISRTSNGLFSPTMTEEPSISCTTFNILAPIYKRLDHQVETLDIIINSNSFIYHDVKFFLFLFFLFSCGCETEPEYPGKRFQGILVHQESEDFGLVTLRKVFHYMSPGG